MNANLGKLYGNGQVIVKEGDVGSCMFAIQRGRVEVVKGDDGPGQVKVAELKQGDIFGEMAIFENEVRSATVRAVGEAVVMTIDKKTFMRRIEADPSIAFTLVRMMSQRIRRLSSELAPSRPDVRPEDVKSPVQTGLPPWESADGP